MKSERELIKDMKDHKYSNNLQMKFLKNLYDEYHNRMAINIANKRVNPLKADMSGAIAIGHGAISKQELNALSKKVKADPASLQKMKFLNGKLTSPSSDIHNEVVRSIDNGLHRNYTQNISIPSQNIEAVHRLNSVKSPYRGFDLLFGDKEPRIYGRKRSVYFDRTPKKAK
jgi:hypothetical protein